MQPNTFTTLSINKYASQSTILLCIAFSFSLIFLLSQPVNICLAHKSAHTDLITTLNYLRLHHNRTQLQSHLAIPDPDHYFLHNALRTTSSNFLSIQNLPASTHCHPLRFPSPYTLEWSAVARYPTDGILLYLLSRLGARSRRIIEIDAARGDGSSHLTASLALLHGYDLLSIHEAWSAYASTYAIYEHHNRWPSAKRSIIDASTSAISSPVDALASFAKKEGFAGAVDLLILFNGLGQDVKLLQSLPDLPFQPRILVIFYQDYWGLKSDRIRMGKGISDGADTSRERLLVGGSLAAIIRLGKAAGLQLIWCARSAPIAVFIDINEATNAKIKSLSASRCMKIRQTNTGWYADSEAAWDLAQTVEWESML